MDKINSVEVKFFFIKEKKVGVGEKIKIFFYSLFFVVFY